MGKKNKKISHSHIDGDDNHQDHKAFHSKEESKRSSKQHTPRASHHVEVDLSLPEENLGKGIFKVSWIVFTYSALTPVFCAYLMHKYNNYTTGAWLWASIYCFLNYMGLLKQCIFPDSFEERVNMISSIFVFGFSSLYMYPGYLMFSFQADTNPSIERVSASMLMAVFGMFLVTSADCQKYFTIKAKRASNPNDRSLITEGMFKWTRNPNYLGEIILYSAFCHLVNDLSAWLVYLFVWSTLFYSRMVAKDKRLMRKPGHQEYFKRTCMLFPKFTTCWYINLMIYINIVTFIFILYVSGGVENLIKNSTHLITTEVYDFKEVKELIHSYTQ